MNIAYILRINVTGVCWYRECEGVELPSETDVELNTTLKLGSEVLQASAVAADDQQATLDEKLIHHTADRLTQGITVLHHIRGMIGVWWLDALHHVVLRYKLLQLFNVIFLELVYLNKVIYSLELPNNDWYIK